MIFDNQYFQTGFVYVANFGYVPITLVYVPIDCGTITLSNYIDCGEITIGALDCGTITLNTFIDCGEVDL